MERFVATVMAVLFLHLAVAYACYEVSAQAAGGTAQVPWGYGAGPRGPRHWHELKRDWGVCKKGHRQSPINITADAITTDRRLRNLDARYRKKIRATIANDGHAVVVGLAPDAGALRINGVTYTPLQFHFHSPSEHLILGKAFPLEFHLVHKSEDGKLAVIAFLFVEGEESEFLAQFTDKLPSYKNPHVKTDLGKIKLLKMGRNYGRYVGSLTTPPCAEDVTWTVMLWNFPTVSPKQLEALRISVPHDNNRPAFPSAGRGFHTNF